MERTARHRVGLLAGVAAAVAIAAACGSAARDGGPFRKVRAPVAFEIILDSPEVAIVDLRGRGDFHGPLGHLEGARNVPLGELPRRYLEILDLRDETFLVYCHASECDPEAMDFLRQHGFEDAMLIDGGIVAWIEGGFRTVGVGDPEGHIDDPSLGASPTLRLR
jgi:rhodanese-related sulfurtransferase